MSLIAKDVLRKRLAQSLSEMFAGEVPEYKAFTDIVRLSNESYLAANPNAVVDSENRVLAEKHGAIRVGTAEEMRMVARIFAACGMEPVEFYDMTQLPGGKALPMIATAFRPIDKSIETSAFRMFCSMLHPDFIPDDEVKVLLEERRSGNPKFFVRLHELLLVNESKGGLNEKEADEFITEVVNSFRFKRDKVFDFKLYSKLRRSSDVLADIVCFGINLNHLTPRAYDIRDAANKLVEAGIPMKDGGIEGPPLRGSSVVTIQLNQTSRKAPGEEIMVSNNPGAKPNSNTPVITLAEGENVESYLSRIEAALKDNELVIIQHKARFGEIESRGVALTPDGESLYKSLLADKKFSTLFPETYKDLFEKGFAYYTYAATGKKPAPQVNGIDELVAQGYVKLVPQTYDDFLAASAAGIFKSNMTSGTDGVVNIRTETVKNREMLEDALGKRIISRHDIHQVNYAKSIIDTYNQLGMTIPAQLKLEAERIIKTKSGICKV